MQIVLASATVAIVMLGASGALAQAQPQESSQPTATSATTGPASSTDTAKVICRPIVVDGMVIHGRQACHTQAEWDSARQHNRQQLDQMQLNNLTMQPH